MVLLNKCQEEFERGSKLPPDDLEGPEKAGFEYKARKGCWAILSLSVNCIRMIFW